MARTPAVVLRWLVVICCCTTTHLLLLPTAEAIWLNLPSSGTKCVSEEIQNNVVVLADYGVVGDDTHRGALPTISASVTSPFGNNLHRQENVTHGQFAFTTKEAGNYGACFWVDGNHQGGQDVTVSLEWRIGVNAKDWETVARKEKIEGVELELMKLEGAVQAIHQNLIYLKDRLLVWRGDSKTKDVYFDDIIHIIKEDSITNNVIDAYGEILLELQGLVNPSLEDSSFIFTSTCLKIVQEYPPHKRNKLIDVHIKEYQGQRFLIFPIHDNFHWTIVVYDVKENVWRHYNSLRPREGIHDPHIDKAQMLRDYITALVHNIGPSSPLWTNLSSQNTSKTIILVDICPQQAPNSVDCGPAVCYIMRAHVYREDIVASLARYEWCQIRDSLVHLFLNHRKTVQCENL